MSTPEIHLRTLYLLDGAGRIRGTREPDPEPGPKFTLVRGRAGCVWAARADAPAQVAAELDALAREEPPVADFRQAPVHAERYRALVGGEVYFGPAFTFPETIEEPDDTARVDGLPLLARHFSGWTAAEIAGCSPIIAVMADGHAVSVCFCARRTDAAAEAGLETAAAFRGRGYGARAAAAWALAVRASGRAPLYSTSWENGASLAVARKLGLRVYACGWSLG